MTDENESIVTRMANHDNSEERRYLREGPRLCLTWSWFWLTWGLGLNFSVDPHGEERCSAWLLLGPLCVEALWRKPLTSTGQRGER